MTTRTEQVSRKTMIIDYLKSLETQELATAQARRKGFARDSRLDERETHDKDEIAASREKADMAAAQNALVHNHQTRLDLIENIDFGLTDTISPGAVVRLKGDTPGINSQSRHFVVCVSTGQFEIDGKAYMGISAGSPLYRAMADMCVGDVFIHNRIEYEIEEIL